jgi:hypothetical protein
LRKDQTMKRKRHTEEQIIGILKEHEAGVKTADLSSRPGSASELGQLEAESAAGSKSYLSSKTHSSSSKGLSVSLASIG